MLAVVALSDLGDEYQSSIFQFFAGGTLDGQRVFVTFCGQKVRQKKIIIENVALRWNY
jgi:hypothetical protein